MRASVERAFARFEEEGVPPEELARVKAGTETSFYRGLSSAIGKAFSLAQYTIFAGSPGFVTEDLQRTLDVRTALGRLSERDRAVCRLLAEGESVTSIAGLLECSWHTVDAIVARIRGQFESLGLGDCAGF